MIDAEPGQTPKAKRKAPLWFWSLASIILFMLILPLSLILSNRFTKSGTEWLPVSLHSILESDYSADSRGSRIPAAKLDLIKAAIRDQSSGEDLDRFEDVIVSLSTPVATIQSGFPPASATPTPTQLPTPSPTQTPTRSTLPTRTPRPTTTTTPTATWVTPSQTIKPTREPTKPSTRTPTPPPRKPQPTNTPRPTQEPTNPPSTEAPPTKPPPTREPYPPPSNPKPTQDPYP